MSDSSDRNPEFLQENGDNVNLLWQYVQSLSPETVSQLSKPGSGEVFKVMERNIVGLLGSLPSDNFGVNVSTSREHLGRLLASAMISGYFLRNAEQRMTYEKSWDVDILDRDSKGNWERGD